MSRGRDPSERAVRDRDGCVHVLDLSNHQVIMVEITSVFVALAGFDQQFPGMFNRWRRRDDRVLFKSLYNISE